MIVTHNLDDLHERAGNHEVIHMHGELKSAWCMACGMRWIWKLDLGDNPPCPGCQQTGMRPDIVWFGEPVYQLAEINAAVDSCELFVVIGGGQSGGWADSTGKGAWRTHLPAQP